MGKNCENWLQYNLLMIFAYLLKVGAVILEKYWMGCDILAGQFLSRLTEDNNDIDSTLRHLTFK